MSPAEQLARALATLRLIAAGEGSADAAQLVLDQIHAAQIHEAQAQVLARMQAQGAIDACIEVERLAEGTRIAAC